MTTTRDPDTVSDPDELQALFTPHVEDKIINIYNEVYTMLQQVVELNVRETD